MLSCSLCFVVVFLSRGFEVFDDLVFLRGVFALLLLGLARVVEVGPIILAGLGGGTFDLDLLLEGLSVGVM